MLCMTRNYKNIPSLRKYVLTKKKKNLRELEQVGVDWARVCSENRISYELDWLGVPIIQTPEDIILLQEVIFKTQPDIIIEVGIAHGGGLIFEASLLELLGINGKVIGVDIEIRPHNRKAIESHPLAKKIKLIQGNSTAPETIAEIKKNIPKGANALVCLDSDHTKPHVLRELNLYQQFIKPGSYMVVFDMISSDLAKMGSAPEQFFDNGPAEAVYEFLQKNKNFKIDKEFNKFYSSHNWNGYLKKIK